MGAIIHDVVDPIAVGDVVFLKSGSCPMTVARVEKDMAVLVWQDRHLQGQTMPSPLKALRLGFDEVKDSPFAPIREVK